MQLIDKVAIVTGGSGALGSVISNRLSSEGARVTATYGRSKNARRIDNPLNQRLESLCLSNLLHRK